MTALAPDGLRTMTNIVWRTGWKGLVGWTAGIGGLALVTVGSVAGLYPTDDDRRGYAASLAGGAAEMLNGEVAGVDTLGGIFANEFAVILSFGIPLMAIALTVRATRRDEAAGRLELLLSARVGRRAPLLAAVLVAIATLTVTAVLCGLAMFGFGAAAAGSATYALGIAAVGVVFVGVTAVAAQLVEHQRGVWGIALAVLLTTYLVRGAGALGDNALVWLSPLGWVDEARAFGDLRLWPVAMTFAVGAALVGAAFALNTRRDLGSALIRPRASSPRASAFLRTPFGLAVRQQRMSILGWTVAATAFMAMYGSLTQEVLSAIRDNPTIGDLIGADSANGGERLLRTVMSTFVLTLAMIVAAYVVACLGSLRNEETSARLELELSGGRSRRHWLATHLGVVAGGAVLVGASGALALGVATAVSMDDAAWIGDVTWHALAFVPAVAIFVGLAVALFGWLPRRQAAVTWGVFAAAAAIGYLGAGLGLAEALVRLSPFRAVGDDVVGSGASLVGMTTASVLASALVVAGFVGFRRRDVPVT